MEQSILISTKKILNVASDDTSFDLDIITNINTAFSHLHQLGIGPRTGFQIEDETAEWEDFLPPPESETPQEETYLPILNSIKTNIGIRVRSLFDPPTMPHLMTAMQQQLQESNVHLSNLRETTDWVDPDPPTLPEEDGFV